MQSSSPLIAAPYVILGKHNLKINNSFPVKLQISEAFS